MPTDPNFHDQLVSHNERQPGFVDLNLPTQPLQTVGVIGAGLMGRSIATICVQAGKHVRLLDANADVAAAAVAAIAKCAPKRDLERFPKNHAAADIDDSGAIVHATDYAQLADCQLVIESVVETPEVKKIVLGQLAQHVSDDTIIASNTSAIPITKLAKFAGRGSKFCGIHFCHPELMSLVEVVEGQSTSAQTMADATQFVRSLKKLPVAVHDTAGFVVNRLLAAMIDQSLRVLMSGVPIETIDQAMREFGFRGGPFEIMDIIGIDTCMYAGRTMWEAGVECVSLSPVLPKLVKRGRLGRKSGCGFYRYATFEGSASPDDSLLPLIEAYLAKPLSDAQENTLEQRKKIQTQVLAAIAREAFFLREEGIARDVRDIDLCIIHGFSFPANVGGILRWADTVGLDTVVQTLEAIASAEPNRVAPAGLVAMANAGRSFYDAAGE